MIVKFVTIKFKVVFYVIVIYLRLISVVILFEVLKVKEIVFWFEKKRIFFCYKPSQFFKMSSSNPGKQRADTDIIKLVQDNYEVDYTDNRSDIIVKLHGPEDTPYEGGVWKVRVHIPEDYPFKSPSIGFVNKIFHPNIDILSGSVCLNVINEKWTAIYNLSNIFDTFLPQLLTNPNPDDPLNHDAASLYLESREKFKQIVAVFIEKYATEDALSSDEKKSDSTDTKRSSMSELSDTE